MYGCEVAEYPNVDILVGVHGAGITNVMFMKPGSLLVEIVDVLDGRMLPVCGYHGPLAALEYIIISIIMIGRLVKRLIMKP